MDELYILETLSDFVQEDEEYLDEFDLDLPVHIPVGYYPTVAQIEIALRNLGVGVEKTNDGGALHFLIKDFNQELWTELVITKPSSIREASSSIGEASIGFHKGSELLIAKVVQSLTNACGPFAVIPASGSDPMIISSDTDLSQFDDSGWNHGFPLVE